MTTLPRLAPIVTLTRVSRWSASSSSSSSSPGGREPARRGRRAGLGGASVGRCLGRRPRRGPHGLLDLAHRQVLGDGPPGQRLLEGSVGRAEQRPGVAGGQLAVGHEVLDRRRELEQAQGVGDRRAALADPLGDLLLGELEVLDQLLVGRGLLERVEVLAVEVLDQRLLERRRRRRRRARSPGSSARPARLAARQRRSPAMSS